jgi:hypothetical protein
MNLLTPTGYKDINDVNIGDELIAYDINTGEVIINTLLDKKLWTNDMLPSNPPSYDEDGNVLEDGMTSEEVFEQTYGDWKFYEINGTWKLFKNQSIWANIKVVHVSELQIGDVIYNDEDGDIVITSIVECVEPTWWRLEVSGDHSYISDNLQLHNASRYWSGNMTPTSFNWNYSTGGTNWGSASGVADNASVPSSVDDAIFDGAGTKGNTNSIISVIITVLSLTVTSGYTSTMTHNAVLTIAGNVTLNTSYTISGSSGIVISADSTITSNGKTFPNNVTFSGVSTKTLNGSWIIGGSVTISSTTTLNQTGTDSLSCSGLVQSVNISGTAKIILKGGTWSNSQVISCGCDLDLDGNISISNGNIGNGKTIKYLSGTITHSGTFYVTSPGAIIDVAPVIFLQGFFLNGAFTITINSLLKFSGNLEIGQSNKTYSGTSGWETNTLTNNIGAISTQTLKNGVTYTVNTGINIRTSGAFVSDSATLRAIFLLKNGASCNTNCSFTRIDASGGRTINSWNGTITDCINVRSFTDLQTVSSGFIN